MSPECQNCGAHVSERFARVCGDEDNIAHTCPRCDSKGAIRAGSAAGKELRLDQGLRQSLSERASEPKEAIVDD